MKNQSDRVLLTSYAVGELEGAESKRFSSLVDQDALIKKTVEDTQKISRLIEGALNLESESRSHSLAIKSKRKAWFFVPAAAVAAFLLVFGLPYVHQKNEGYTVGTEADAYAASFSPGTNKEAIRKVVQDHLVELKKCYEDELPSHPTLAGKVLVRFTFAEDGLVSEASIVRSMLKSAAVENCIVDRVKAWQFPNASKGTKAVVEYPFVFDSK